VFSGGFFIVTLFGRLYTPKGVLGLGRLFCPSTLVEGQNNGAGVLAGFKMPAIKPSGILALLKVAGRG